MDTSLTVTWALCLEWKEKDGELRLLTLSNVDSDHRHHLDDVAHPWMCQVVVVVVVGVQRW